MNKVQSEEKILIRLISYGRDVKSWSSSPVVLEVLLVSLLQLS